MNTSPDGIADEILAGERFRITVTRNPADARYHLWTVVLYDLADHGPEIPYARIDGDDLLSIMTTTAHYIYVAGTDSSERSLHLLPNAAA